MSQNQEIEDMTDETQDETSNDQADALAPVTDLVAAAIDGNALRVQEMFNLLVVDRIQALIEERKPYIAQSLLVPEDVDEDEDEDTVDEDVEDEDESEVEPLKESVEQIDEISKKVMGSYVDKARDDIKDRSLQWKVGTPEAWGASPMQKRKVYDALMDKNVDRAGYVDKAINKMKDRS